MVTYVRRSIARDRAPDIREVLKMWLNVIYFNKKTSKIREFNIHCPKINTCNVDNLTIKDCFFISHVIEFYRSHNETAKTFDLTEKKGYIGNI